jgi:hypothetical protein
LATDRGVHKTERHPFAKPCGLQGEGIGVDPVVDGGEVVELGTAVGVADGNVTGTGVVLLKPGRMRGDENPWMVVSTGVGTSPE